jgi:hypothetical protein
MCVLYRAPQIPLAIRIVCCCCVACCCRKKKRTTVVAAYGAGQP